MYGNIHSKVKKNTKFRTSSLSRRRPNLGLRWKKRLSGLVMVVVRTLVSNVMTMIGLDELARQEASKIEANLLIKIATIQDNGFSLKLVQ